MSTRLYLALLASPRLRALARVSCSMSTLARVPHSSAAAAVLHESSTGGARSSIVGSADSPYGEFVMSMRTNKLNEHIDFNPTQSHNRSKRHP